MTPWFKVAEGGGETQDYLWVVSGVDSPGAERQTVYFYDRVADEWAATTDIPTPRRAAASVIYNDQFFYIGGFDSADNATSTVSIFDISTGTWSTGTAMPTARGKLSHQLYVDNGVVYVAGGATGAPTPRVATNEAYDLVNDTWDGTVTDMPHSHTFPQHSTSGGLHYYLTGNTDSASASIGLCQQYDPAADSWTQLTSHPEGVTDGMGEQYNGAYHSFGGHRSDGTGSRSEHYTYDYTADSWTLVDNLPNTWSHGAAVADPSGIYIYGGARGAIGDKGDPDVIYWDGSTYSETPVDMPAGRWNFGSGVSVTKPPRPTGSRIHQWTFSEGSGTTVGDSVGTADATYNGSWSSGTWVDNYAGDLDGTDDVADVGEPSDLTASSLGSSITIAATVKLRSAGSTQNFVSKASSTSNDNYALTYANGSDTIRFYIETTGGNNTADFAGYSTNTTYRLVCQYDGSAASIWANAERVGSVAASGSIASASGSPFTIGSRGGDDRFLDGLVDNVIVSDTAWSDAEITNDYLDQPWS